MISSARSTHWPSANIYNISVNIKLSPAVHFDALSKAPLIKAQLFCHTSLRRERERQRTPVAARDGQKRDCVSTNTERLEQFSSIGRTSIVKPAG